MSSSLRDSRYLFAYSLPLAAFVGVFYQGWWTWLTPAYVFGLVPFLEWLHTPAPAASEPATTAPVRRSAFFDWLLYLNVPLQYGLLFYYLHVLTHQFLTGWEVAGMVFSVGICCGALGINVAHELGHRAQRAEQRLAQTLLLSTLYLHFFIEHNRGHHRHVATPLDPATALFNEPFYRFLRRSVVGEYRSAWLLERTRLDRQAVPIWSGQNQMLQFLGAQIGALALVGFAFGWVGLLAWVGAAAVGVVLFQLVNYVEHYGLLRRRTAAGAYERVQPHHSWNSEHALRRFGGR